MDYCSCLVLTQEFAQGAKKSSVSRTEGHGKGEVDSGSLFRAIRWIPWLISDPSGAAIGCCWTESAVRICADLGCRGNTTCRKVRATDLRRGSRPADKHGSGGVAMTDDLRKTTPEGVWSIVGVRGAPVHRRRAAGLGAAHGDRRHERPARSP